jgi:hypothetical protein
MADPSPYDAPTTASAEQVELPAPPPPAEEGLNLPLLLVLLVILVLVSVSNVWLRRRAERETRDEVEEGAPAADQ